MAPPAASLDRYLQAYETDINNETENNNWDNNLINNTNFIFNGAF
jgi:hypothetical protein